MGSREKHVSAIVTAVSQPSKSTTTFHRSDLLIHSPAPKNPAKPASFFNILAPSGKEPEPGVPAPLDKEVTEAGIS